MVRFPDGTPASKINQVMSSIYTAKPSRRNKGTGVGLIDQSLSSINEALIGGAEGLSNLASGITDTALRPLVGDEAVKQAQADRKKTFTRLSEIFASRPSPAARVTGQIASTIPLSMVKAPAAVAAVAPRAAAIGTRAVQGALGGLAVRDADQDPGKSAMIGATANVVLPPILSGMMGAGAKAARKVIPQGVREAVTGAGKKVVGALDDAGEAGYNILAPMIGREALPATRAIPAAVEQAAPAMGRAAAARAANFKAAGVKEPTTAMVTRDPKAWTFERETAKSIEHGDELTNAFIKVSDDLDRSSRNLVSAKGGAGDPEAVGQATAKALDAKQKEMRDVTSRLYTSVREARGDVPAGQLDKFRQAIDDPEMTDNPVYDQMRDGVMRRLNRFGMGGDSKLLRKDAVATVTQAEELRKFIGSLGDGKDPSVRRMRGILIESLDDDVVGSLGDDAFKAARASAKARFDEFSKTYAGKIAEGSVAPEKLVRNILSDSTPLSHIRSLKQSLATGTPDQVARGAAAWNGMGAQALDDLFKGARNADGLMSGARLSKNFTKAAPKLRQLLEPTEFKQLQRIVKAARDSSTAPAFSSVNNSNTSSAIANMFAAPSPVGRSTIKNVLQHLGAFAAGGPGGNVALAVGKGVAADRAAQKAAESMMLRVQMAKSPEEAAKVMATMQAKASRDAAFAAALKRMQDFTRNMPGFFANAGNAASGNAPSGR